jgi:plastocyanin
MGIRRSYHLRLLVEIGRVSGARRAANLGLLPILQVMFLAGGAFLPVVSFAGEIAGRVVGPDGAGIAQAVVFVQALPAGVSVSQDAPMAEMDQVHKEFVPPLLPVAVGAQVRFPNRDQIHHHVYSFSRTKSFELPLYKEEDAPPVLFDKPGVVKIGCNIHDWMSAIIFVAPTPYFALTDEAGHFTIEKIPSGNYTVVAWHELSQVKVEETARQVQANEQTPPVVFTLSLAERRPGPVSRKGGNY